MIASSSTVLANLAYLIGAIVVAVIGGLLVWVRHRQPRSVDANMASFRRGLDALAPDPHAAAAADRRADGPRPRVDPGHLTHVRLEPAVAVPAGDDDIGEGTADGFGERAGGHPG